MEIAASQLIALALEYGIPAAIKLIDDIFANVNANGAVGPDEWAKLKVSLQVTASDLTVADMKAKGIDTTTPAAQAVIALTK